MIPGYTILCLIVLVLGLFVIALNRRDWDATPNWFGAYFGMIFVMWLCGAFAIGAAQ